MLFAYILRGPDFVITVVVDALLIIINSHSVTTEVIHLNMF